MIPGATPTKGRLLVATPTLGDPNFERAVIFMLEHHDEGAVGVIINQPAEIPLHEPIDRWADLERAPTGLFHGGPVETDALIALGYVTAPVESVSSTMSPVSGPVVSVDLTTDPAILAGALRQIRVFRGYAGWGGAQLENEIDVGAWIVVDAEPDDVFSPEPGELWRSVLRRQPGRLAWLADAPLDLSLN